MNERKRNAAIAAIVLIVVPLALVLLWRAWSGPGVLVSYTRSGGLAGVTENIVVYRDGAVVARGSADREFRISEERLRAIESALTSAQWPRQPTVYGEPGPDGFQYDISYEGHVVKTYDGAEVPEWLERVLSDLGALGG